MSNLPTRDDNTGQDAEAILSTLRGEGHVWRIPRIDIATGCHVWTCTCNELVYQKFGEPVPDALISHPQSFGQMRGER